MKPIPAHATKVRIRLKNNVRVCEWRPLRDVGAVVDFEAGTEMNVYFLTAADQQNAVYLRLPWGSDIYIYLQDFEVIQRFPKESNE